mgnify:CR=1 FL=1
MTWYTNFRTYIAVYCTLVAAPCLAQEATPPVVFQSGTGNAPIAQPVYVKPPRAEIACDAVVLAQRAISYGYYSGLDLPRQRLDGAVLEPLAGQVALEAPDGDVLQGVRVEQGPA